MKERVLGKIGVTLTGRAGLIYRDGTRTMFIDGEIAFDYNVFVSSIGLWKDTGALASDAERAEIVENLRRVFESANLKVDFCYPGSRA